MRLRETKDVSKSTRPGDRGLVGLGVGVILAAVLLFGFPGTQLLWLALGVVLAAWGWYRRGDASKVERTAMLDRPSSVQIDLRHEPTSPRKMAPEVTVARSVDGRNEDRPHGEAVRHAELDQDLTAFERDLVAWLERASAILSTTGGSLAGAAPPDATSPNQTNPDKTTSDKTTPDETTPVVSSGLAETPTRVVSGVDSVSQAVNLVSLDRMVRRLEMVALNAAIEAARAKEYGRGFAIVASEVRSIGEKMKRELDGLAKTSIDGRGGSDVSRSPTRGEPSLARMAQLREALVELEGMLGAFRAKRDAEVAPGAQVTSKRSSAKASVPVASVASAAAVTTSKRVPPSQSLRPIAKGTPQAASGKALTALPRKELRAIESRRGSLGITGRIPARDANQPKSGTVPSLRPARIAATASASATPFASTNKPKTRASSATASKPRASRFKALGKEMVGKAVERVWRKSNPKDETPASTHADREFPDREVTSGGVESNLPAAGAAEVVDLRVEPEATASSAAGSPAEQDALNGGKDAEDKHFERY
ncbi:MAG: methyl-accepting chemotaxis protein [Polyangiaceae bacterium]